MRVSPVLAASTAVVAAASLAAVLAQRPDAFQVSRDHPAIEYSTRVEATPVTTLNRQIQDGDVRFAFDGPGGYLRSVLDAFKIAAESQVAVFAQNSSQGAIISPRNPRAVFFADSVAVGFVRGGTVLEVAAQDPQQGVIFYTLDQQPAEKPQFKRKNDCLACHLSWDTLGVPGLFVLSAFPLPEDKNAYATGFASDHRLDLEQRWGGWYVTGRPGTVHHMGNVFSVKGDGPTSTGADGLASLDGQFDLEGYPSRYSDVVALMVLEHQAYMTNLLTRVGWEARLASFEERTPSPAPSARGGRSTGAARVREAAQDLVDYLLFVDEAPLARRVQGSSAFAAKFSAQGPRDGKGRTLRDFDLERRLMRYPCSYMIYSAAFDTLPASARDVIYQRMWQILSGQEKRPPYARLKLEDRQAIVEILRDTKKDLPDYFQTVTR
jgi:hypothetical protein